MNGVISTSEHVARTVKRCSQCRGNVLPGERYLRLVWKDGRDFCWATDHVECANAATAWSVELDLHLDDEGIDLLRELENNPNEFRPWLEAEWPEVLHRLDAIAARVD